MREMKDSGVDWIGEMPEKWQRLRFKYIHTLTNVGDSVDKTLYGENEDAFIFYMAGESPTKTSYTRFAKWKYTDNDDLLLARNGTPYIFCQRIYLYILTTSFVQRLKRTTIEDI